MSYDGVNFVSTASVLTETTTYTKNGLDPAITYFFRVRAYNDNGNSGFSNIMQITTQQTSGVEQLRDVISAVYPKPATSTITVEFTQAAQVNVLNVLGEKVAVYQLNKGVNTIDVSKLTRRDYFLQLGNVNAGKTVKFIKQ
jgi:glutamate/tyrosine decarboxylase-like PLP-dependent enzyme